MTKLPDIVLMGPYGSGKGTQISLLAGKYKFHQFDTGKALREEIAAGTEIGKRSEALMQAGKLVQTADVLALIRKFVEQVPADEAIVFDGIPRGLEQYEGFQKIMADNGRNPIPLYINLTHDESIRRQISRKICSVNGRNIDAYFTAEDCMQAGGEVVERLENDPAIATKRTQVYEEQVLPMVEKYRATDPRFIEIDGMPSVEEIHARIIKALQPYVQD